MNDEVKLYSSGTLVSSATVMSDKTVEYGGNDSMYVSSGGTANSTTVSGWCATLYVSSGGVASSTTVNDWGDMFVSSGGVASSTTVNRWGFMYISSGGVASSTTVNSGGNLYLSNGGVATSTTVNSCGLLCVLSEGVASSTTVNSGGNMYVSNGGVVSGSLQIADGAVVSAYSGAVIDFTVAEQEISTQALITHLDYIPTGISFTLTVKTDQSCGVYVLATDAMNFSAAVSVKTTEDEILGDLVVNGAAIEKDGQFYTLSVDNEEKLLLSIQSDYPRFVATSTNPVTLVAGNTYTNPDYYSSNGAAGEVQADGTLTAVGTEGNEIAFVGNTAKYGGAVYQNGGTTSISYVNFSGNTAIDGGAFCVDGGTVEILVAAFGNNIATGDGGAICIGGESFSVSGANFSDNQALIGGAVEVYGGSTTFFSSVFSRNFASKKGGAVYASGGTTTFAYASFQNNRTSGNGGAICVGSDGTVILRGATFNSNTAERGGAVYIDVEKDEGIFYRGSLILDGSVMLSTASDDIYNRGKLIWYLPKARMGDAPVLHGYRYLTNSGGYLVLQVDAEMMAGSYTIATGVGSSLSGKNTFVITGVAGLSDVSITVGSVVQYGNLKYNLSKTGDELVLTVGSGSYDRFVATSTTPVSLTAGKTYTNPDYFNGNGAAGEVNGGILTAVGTVGSRIAFSGNTATGFGGALYVANKSTATFANVIFDCNVSCSSGSCGGGAVYVEDARASFDNVLFSNNGTFRGGALCLDGGSVSIKSSTFSGNSTQYHGGAIELFGGGTSTPCYMTIVNSVFCGNTARGGGALCVYGDSISVTGSTFTQNVSTGTTYYGGGAISVESGSITLADVSFSGNSAAKSGGAIYNRGTVTLSGTVTLATSSDTWVNAGESSYYSTITNWDLSKAASWDSVCINGFQYFSNVGDYTHQTITVAADQELGDYTIATGVGSDLTDKNTFNITGVAGLSDVSITVGGGAVKYNGLDYQLAVTNDNLTLNVSGERPKSINYTLSSNYSNVYDGEAHSVSVTVSDPTMGAMVYYSIDGQKTWQKGNAYSLTNVGSAEVYFKIEAKGYQTVITDSRSITVDQRDVTLTSGSAVKEYDGQPLTNDTVAVSGDGFVDGEGATYTVTGSQTEVGTSKNTFDYTLNANTKASNYEITTVAGDLEVVPEGKTIVTIKVEDYQKTYNGKALKANTKDCTVTGLLSGDKLTMTITGSITDVGTTVVTVDYTIKRGKTDVTDEYKVVVVGGTLTVDKCAITLTSNNAQRDWNGKELTAKKVTVSGGKLASGEKLAYNDFASLTDVGVCSNTFSYAAGNTKTKLSNYDISVVDGMLAMTYGKTYVIDNAEKSIGEEHDFKKLTVQNGGILMGNAYRVSAKELVLNGGTITGNTTSISPTKLSVSGQGNVIDGTTRIGTLSVSTGGKVNTTLKATGLLEMTENSSKVTIGNKSEIDLGILHLTPGNNTVSIGKESTWKCTSILLDAGNDKLSISSGVNFSATLLDFGTGSDTLNIGTGSEVKIGEDITNVSTISASAGKVGDETVLTAGTVTLNANGKSAKATFGNWNHVEIAELDMTYANDTLSFGNNCYAMIDTLDFGGGKDTLKIGKDSTVYLDAKNFSDALKLSAGKGSTLYFTEDLYNYATTALAKSAVTLVKWEKEPVTTQALAVLK